MHLPTTFKLLGLFSLSIATTDAHVFFSIPELWGWSGDSLVDMEYPLNHPDIGSKLGPTQSKVCHGYSRSDGTGTVTLNPGATLQAPIMCGESGVDQDPTKCYNDYNGLHSGSKNRYDPGGCVLAIDYSGQGDRLDGFHIFTVSHACPGKDFGMVTFDIPDNLPPCENCACSWAYQPQIAYAAPEGYMNCFSCRVLGGGMGADRKIKSVRLSDAFSYDGGVPFKDQFKTNGPVAFSVVSRTSAMVPSSNSVRPRTIPSKNRFKAFALTQKDSEKASSEKKTVRKSKPKPIRKIVRKIIIKKKKKVASASPVATDISEKQVAFLRRWQEYLQQIIAQFFH